MSITTLELPSTERAPESDIPAIVERLEAERKALETQPHKGRPTTYAALAAEAFKADPFITPTQLRAKLGCSLSTAVQYLRYWRKNVSEKKLQRRIKHIVGPVYSVTLQGAQLKWLAMKTSDHLDALADRVSKGVGVIAASEFVRWLSMSGVIECCIPEDSHKLRPKLAKLSCMCNDYFRTRGTDIDTEDQQIPMVNKKLDVILAILAKA